MDIHALEENYRAAQQWVERAASSLAKKHQGGEWEEYSSAYTALLTIERELAAAKGEAYAEPLDFPLKWDIGAPRPYLLMNDYKTFLTFYVRTPDPTRDGTCVTVKASSDHTLDLLAVVEFTRCVSAKMGDPNDEVFSGHPLAGRGLDSYTVQIVRNSTWLAELETINSVHSLYAPDRWRSLIHYIFWFHDSTFECVAETHKVDLFNGSMRDLLAKIAERLVE